MVYKIIQETRTKKIKSKFSLKILNTMFLNYLFYKVWNKFNLGYMNVQR